MEAIYFHHRKLIHSMAWIADGTNIHTRIKPNLMNGCERTEFSQMCQTHTHTRKRQTKGTLINNEWALARRCYVINYFAYALTLISNAVACHNPYCGEIKWNKNIENTVTLKCQRANNFLVKLNLLDVELVQIHCRHQSEFGRNSLKKRKQINSHHCVDTSQFRVDQNVHTLWSWRETVYRHTTKLLFSFLFPSISGLYLSVLSVDEKKKSESLSPTVRQSSWNDHRNHFN